MVSGRGFLLCAARGLPHTSGSGRVRVSSLRPALYASVPIAAAAAQEYSVQNTAANVDACSNACSHGNSNNTSGNATMGTAGGGEGLSRMFDGTNSLLRSGGGDSGATTSTSSGNTLRSYSSSSSSSPVSDSFYRGDDDSNSNNNNINNKGYARYVPQRFRRYSSGSAVGDYSMLRKAYARTWSTEYRHKPFDKKWEGILDALRPLQRISTGNTFTPYYDTGDAYRAMWASIEGAKEKVKWQTYICKDDTVGKKTIRLIEEANDRGVEVELLYDCGGNITGRTRLTQGLVHRQLESEAQNSSSSSRAAVEKGTSTADADDAAAQQDTKKKRSPANVIAFRPFMINFYKYYRNGMRWQHSPALRSHRKILIVDEKEAYAGGLNIGDDYCAKDVGGNGRFRDTHCKVEGPAVRHLIEVYNDTITPVHSKVTPWRTITAASARRRLQYLKAKARQISAGTQQTMKDSMPKAKNTLSNMMQKEYAYSTRTLQRMRDAATRRGAQLRLYDFKKFRHPFAALKASGAFGGTSMSGVTNNGSKPKIGNGDHLAKNGEEGEGVNKARESNNSEEVVGNTSSLVRRGVSTRRERQIELARGGIRFIKSKASRARYAISTTASAMGTRAVAASHKAADAVEHTLERVVNTANDTTEALYPLPASDDKPIPEAKAFEGKPALTQVLMCNPLTLDWSLPMAMWLVTNDAHRRVWVTTPYYLPHRKLTAAIISAARRGVDVRIIAGSRNTTDPWFMWYASQFVTQRFLQAGVRVYEFEGGQIMHAKTVVVDSVWSSVGSYNWDVMSNKLMEVSVTTFGTEEAAMMEDHFRRDLAKSREISLEEFMDRSLFRRLQCGFFYYGMRFAEWMSFWNYYDPQIDTRQE